MLSLGAVRAAAALPAVLAAVMSAFGLGLGSSGTASLLPAPKPEPVSAAPTMAEPVAGASPAADIPAPPGRAGGARRHHPGDQHRFRDAWAAGA